MKKRFSDIALILVAVATITFTGCKKDEDIISVISVTASTVFELILGIYFSLSFVSK